MPNLKLTMRPGIVKETTPYSATSSFVDGNRIRFRYGQAQTVGGWQQYNLSVPALDGTCRSLLGWKAHDDNTTWLGAGTSRRLYVESGGQLSDVTPVRSSGTLTNPFTTVSGSVTVTVVHSSHGLAVGDIIEYASASSVGGLTLNGEFLCVTVVDVNTYTITSPNSATASQTGGGSVTYQYLITTGSIDQTAGFGWGVGTYGAGTYGTPRGSGGIPIDITAWTLQNFGQDLVANQRGGSIYRWIKANGAGTRAFALGTGSNGDSAAGNAPLIANTILMTQDRILVAYGTSDLGAATNYDSLLIRWADQGDLSTWTPALTNIAGNYRLQSGSAIVGARYLRGQILVFTDIDVYVQSPLDAPLVFGFNQVATGCGLIAKDAVAIVGSTAFWMGRNQFWTFTAGVQPIECPVLRYVFDNLNITQYQKVFAGANVQQNEIWFFYPSGKSSEVDSYVAYNYVENHWTIGSISRTAWIDVNPRSPGNPIAIDKNGVLFSHEIGSTDNGAPMGEFLLTSPMDIASGEDIMLVTRYYPDFAFGSPSGIVNVTFTSFPYGGTTAVDTPEVLETTTESFVKGPYAIVPKTPKVDLYLRGRQVQMQITGSGTFWKLGVPRFAVQPDGFR